LTRNEDVLRGTPACTSVSAQSARPFFELTGRITALSPGYVVDLGRGPGGIARYGRDQPVTSRGATLNGLGSSPYVCIILATRCSCAAFRVVGKVPVAMTAAVWAVTWVAVHRHHVMGKHPKT